MANTSQIMLRDIPADLKKQQMFIKMQLGIISNHAIEKMQSGDYETAFDELDQLFDKLSHQSIIDNKDKSYMEMCNTTSELTDIELIDQLKHLNTVYESIIKFIANITGINPKCHEKINKFFSDTIKLFSVQYVILTEKFYKRTIDPIKILTNCVLETQYTECISKMGDNVDFDVCCSLFLKLDCEIKLRYAFDEFLIRFYGPSEIETIKKICDVVVTRLKDNENETVRGVRDRLHWNSTTIELNFPTRLTHNPFKIQFDADIFNSKYDDNEIDTCVQADV